MVEAFDGSFTASHDLPNFSVGEVLDKFQDEQLLSFRWQPADESEKRILLFSTDERGLRMVAFGRQHRDISDGDFLSAAAVTVPIGDQVVRDAVQPGRKRQSSVLVPVKVSEGAVERPGGQILGVVVVSCPVIDVAIDLVYVPFIERPKRFRVALGTRNQL